MSFKWGFVKGFSETVDKSIQQSIKESKEGVRRAADFHVRRREAAQNKYEDQLEDAEKAINLFSGLTGGDVEKAAQLVRSAGGPQNSQAFFDQIKTAIGLGANPDDLLAGYATVEGAPRTSTQLANHFATLRPMLTPEGEDPTGWAKLFKVKGVKETVDEEMASRGFADQGAERTGTISPATVDYKLLYPEKAAAFANLQAKTSYTKAQESARLAELPRIKAETEKINEEIKNMGPESRANIDRMVAQAKSSTATAEKTQQQLRMSRRFDVQTYEAALEKTRVEILREKAGSEIEDHITFLNAHNAELMDTMSNQRAMGAMGESGYQDAARKKDINDATLVKYWGYMSDEQKATAQSKLNPITTFNTLFNQQLSMEGLKFKKGVGENITEIFGNQDILKINRAYDSTIKSYTAGFGALGGPAAMMLKAAMAGQEVANAAFVAKKVKQSLTPNSLGAKAPISIRDKKTSKLVPQSQLIEGQVYDMGPNWTKPTAEHKGYALPYAVWHGTGWIYSARNQ